MLFIVSFCFIFLCGNFTYLIYVYYYIVFNRKFKFFLSFISFYWYNLVLYHIFGIIYCTHARVIQKTFLIKKFILLVFYLFCRIFVMY